MMPTQGLIFPFADVISECEVMKTYAKSVLDPTTVNILDEVKGNLQNIRAKASTTSTTPWQIPIGRPLRTNWSVGESQPNNKSKHRVRGVFSFIWEIRPLDEDKWTGRKHFLLDGKASTVIDVMEEHDGKERRLARWTVEVGDHQSPGIHFHVQLNGFEEPPFPRSLDVPRLPGLAMSPFLAIESAIGELFQDRWKQHAAAETDDSRRWRNIHRPRLERFFRWQTERLAKVGGSPWMALKTAKPAPELLVAEARA